MIAAEFSDLQGVIQCGIFISHTEYRFGKNRDAKKTKVHLEPVWSGHRDDADNPLSLRLKRRESAPSKEGLPATAGKLLEEIRTAGPCTKKDAYAGIKRHRTTKGRNLKLLLKRNLVEKLDDGRLVSVEESDSEGVQ